MCDVKSGIQPSLWPEPQPDVHLSVCPGAYTRAVLGRHLSCTLLLITLQSNGRVCSLFSCLCVQLPSLTAKLVTSDASLTSDCPATLHCLLKRKEPRQTEILPGFDSKELSEPTLATFLQGWGPHPHVLWTELLLGKLGSTMVVNIWSAQSVAFLPHPNVTILYGPILPWPRVLAIVDCTLGYQVEEALAYRRDGCVTRGQGMHECFVPSQSSIGCGSFGLLVHVHPILGWGRDCNGV